jgi:hypothetical protein
MKKVLSRGEIARDLTNLYCHSDVVFLDRKRDAHQSVCGGLICFDRQSHSLEHLCSQVATAAKVRMLEAPHCSHTRRVAM